METMGLKIEACKKLVIDWDSSSYLWRYTSSDDHKARRELTDLLKMTYDIASKKDIREGDTWEDIVFELVCRCYSEEMSKVEDKTIPYDGYLGHYEINQMIDAIIKITREHTEHFRSMMNTLWTIEFYKPNDNMQGEIIEWYLPHWMNNMWCIEEHRRKEREKELSAG